MYPFLDVTPEVSARVILVRVRSTIVEPPESAKLLVSAAAHGSATSRWYADSLGFTALLSMGLGAVLDLRFRERRLRGAFGFLEGGI